MLEQNCHPEYLESTFLDETIKYTLRWFCSSAKKAKSRVCQSQVCYLHATHLVALKEIEIHPLTFRLKSTLHGLHNGMHIFTRSSLVKCLFFF